MKKLTVLFTLIFSLTIISQVNAQIQAGAALMYGSEIEELGLQANGTFNFTGNIRGALDIGFFFADDAGDLETSFWTINTNGHYLIPGIPKANVYGLAGLNFATTSVEGNTAFGSIDDSTTELGLNLGGGAELPLGGVNIFSEVKYVVGDADQLVLTGGVRIGLGL